MSNNDFNFKEYLDARFDKIETRFDAVDRRLETIESDLKEHRKVETEIRTDVSVLKSKMNILMSICGAVGTGLLVGIIKHFFFT